MCERKTKRFQTDKSFRNNALFDDCNPWLIHEPFDVLSRSVRKITRRHITTFLIGLWHSAKRIEQIELFRHCAFGNDPRNDRCSATFVDATFYDIAVDVQCLPE